MAQPSNRNDRRPRVVVVGAGFAGMAALEVLDTLPVEVTLVDRNAFHTFQPLLYQVATGGLNPGDVAYPARATLRRYRRTTFHLGELTGVEWDERRIVLGSGYRLPYDFLILAFGADTNYFSVPGAAEHALAIYTIDQATKVRDHVFASLERFAAEHSPGAHLSLVVVGGGPTGVEMAGSLAEVRNGLLPVAFPELTAEQVHVVLVEQVDRTLSGFDRRLSSYSAEELTRRGVELHLDTAVKEVRPDAVVLSDGSLLEHASTVWAAGVKAPSLAGQLDLAQGRGGRLEVEADLRLKDHPECFSIGDVAAAHSKGELLPQLAQPAIQQGTHAAKQIGRLLEGVPTAAFTYHDRGMMATIGRRAAVVQLPGGLRLRASPAWVAWLVLHLYKLLGPRNRISVIANLAWRYMRWPRSVKVIVGG